MRDPHNHFVKVRAPRAAAIVLVVAVAVWGGYKFWSVASDDGPTSVPFCSWPLRIHGTPNREEAGLIRCYVRALAQRSVAGLQAVAVPPVRISAAQFARAADARAGTATATFIPNPSDSAFFTVRIEGYSRGCVEMKSYYG